LRKDSHAIRATRHRAGFNGRALALVLPEHAGHIRAVRPDHGGRLELKLVEATDATARYAVLICTPLAELSALAEVTAPSAAVEMGVWSATTPPPWLEALARTLLRSVLRHKLSEGEWPRRVTRWRPEPVPRGSDSR